MKIIVRSIINNTSYCVLQTKFVTHICTLVLQKKQYYMESLIMAAVLEIFYSSGF